MVEIKCLNNRDEDSWKGWRSMISNINLHFLVWWKRSEKFNHKKTYYFHQVNVMSWSESKKKRERERERWKKRLTWTLQNLAKAFNFKANSSSDWSRFWKLFGISFKNEPSRLMEVRPEGWLIGELMTVWVRLEIVDWTPRWEVASIQPITDD